MVAYSVIVPIYNERDSIKALFDGLYHQMRSINSSFEIIFVNDGSDDNSDGILEELSLAHSDLIAVHCGARAGKSAALKEGFARSKGSSVITIDGDLQYDPGDITPLLNKKNEGFDVVCGWRHKRCDPYTKISAARLANYLRRLAFREKIHDVGCSFRVYTRESFAAIGLYRERHRFITAILRKRGFKLGEVKVRHYPRRAGTSKYNTMGKLFRSIPDFFAILING